ncbi:MAG: glucoamylase family protein, partial [Gammaproteobacteria bacterium]
HFVNGVTGAAIPFGTYDDGADLVETAYVAQGLLTVRQYFDNTGDPTETAVRDLATQLWEDIDWYWHLRRDDPAYADNESLFWHWSPNYGWQMNMPIRGYNECMITYLLAIASPTHPIPAGCYYHGWADNIDDANGRDFYGETLPVGSYYSGYGGPMFFAHYTHLGFDPNWSDAYCNYHYNNRQIALSDRAYCAANPGGFAGYSNLVWGLTASYNPYTGYKAHCPVDVDDGTITPTAAISSIVYTPDESIATLKHFYHTYGPLGLWGPFGFVDAFNLNYPDWYANGYIAIDQGPIVVMIENYRSGLCWDLFMANPEITSMMAAIAAIEPTPVTFDDFDGSNINDGWFGSGGAPSWTIDTANTEQVHSGTYALKVVYDKSTEPWAYLYAQPSAGSRDWSDNIMLKTWIYPSKNATYIVKAEWTGGAVERYYSMTANTWQEVIITFGSKANNMTNIDKVLIFPEAGSPGGSGTFWLDDIQLK